MSASTLKSSLCIYLANLFLGNTIVFFLCKTDFFTGFMLLEFLFFNIFLCIFFIFLIRFYKNYQGKYARFLLTYFFVLSVIFFSQGIVIAIMDTKYSWIDAIESFALGGLTAVAFTFIFWLPIGLLNFFALSWIFRNKNVDQKTYNKNV